MTWWAWKCRAWRTVSIGEYAKHGVLFTVQWNGGTRLHGIPSYCSQLRWPVLYIWIVPCQRYGVYRTLSCKRRMLQIAISAYYRRMRHMLYCKRDMSNRNLKRIIFQEKHHYASLVYCVVGEFDADYLDGNRQEKYQKKMPQKRARTSESIKNVQAQYWMSYSVVKLKACRQIRM